MEQDEEIRQWTKRDLFDIGGEKIGSIEDVRYDETGFRPKWLLVKTGLFGSKKMFVPAAEVRSSGGELSVAYTKERVKNAPHVGDTDFLLDSEEMELETYYGLDYAPAAAGRPGGEADQS